MADTNNAALSLKQLQDIARDYNEAHTPIPLKQPKAALLEQLQERGALDEEKQGRAEERLARVIETVAREAAIYALKMEDRRRYYEAQERRSGRRSKGGKKRHRSTEETDA